MINMIAEGKTMMITELSRWIEARNYIFQDPILEQVLLNIFICDTALKNFGINKPWCG